MGTPDHRGRRLWEVRELVAGDVPIRPDAGVSLAGVAAAAFIAGLVAIRSCCATCARTARCCSFVLLPASGSRRSLRRSGIG